MTSAEKYVLAAYLVFLAAVLSYLVIIALKVGRLEQEIADLARLARERRRG
jgi:heme exporter protein D